MRGRVLAQIVDAPAARPRTRPVSGATISVDLGGAVDQSAVPAAARSRRR